MVYVQHKGNDKSPKKISPIHKVMHTAHCLGWIVYQIVESRVKTKHIVKDQNNSVHKINAK